MAIEILEVFDSIFSVIASLIGIIAIIIVIWDHFKDDRILTKNVQEFYEDLENLIYLYYIIEIIDDTFRVLNEFGRDKGFSEDVLEKNFFESKREYLTFQGKIKQKFDDYGKYLG